VQVGFGEDRMRLRRRQARQDRDFRRRTISQQARPDNHVIVEDVAAHEA
jgi:hypothetical protein